MALYTDYDSPSTVDYDVFAINNAIKNILFTQIGSVPGKPDFGSRLYELIFGQIDHITISQLKKLIQEPLYRWEKRIKRHRGAGYPEIHSQCGRLKCGPVTPGTAKALTAGGRS